MSSSSSALLDLSTLSVVEEITTTNSIATRLPPELLHCIFHFAVDSSYSSASRFTTKLSCAQVCRSWYIAANVGVEYVVDHSKKAEQLTDMLTRSGRGGDVRTLDLSCQGIGSRRGFRLAQLVKACPGVIRLCFTALGSFSPEDFLGSSAEDDLFGPALLKAVKSLHHVQSILIDFKGVRASLDGFIEIARGLPSLQHLAGLNIRSGVESFSIAHSKTSTLRSVVLHTWHQHSCSYLPNLLLALPKTLTSFKIDGCLDVSVENVLQHLNVDLSSLETLQIPDSKWIHDQSNDAASSTSHLSSFFTRNYLLSSISVGPNTATPSVVLSTFAALPHLHTLSITCSTGSTFHSMTLWSPATTVNTLERLFELNSSLKNLWLPKQLVDQKFVEAWSWSEEDLERVRDVAERVGIRLGFA